MSKSPLEQWLAEISADSQASTTIWDPGFNSGRQLVVAKIGFFQNAFERGHGFTPRFYHKIYPLPIDEWRFNRQIKLCGGYCTIDALITIRFQASIRYAQINLDALPNVNQRVRTQCDSLVKDVVDQELHQLGNGDWVEQGLGWIERQIETAINEALTQQFLQCRTVCEMLTTFSDMPDPSVLDSRFAHDDIYLKITKKNFEVQEQQLKERLRQEMVLEQQRLERQQRLIDQYNQEQALHRIEQEQAALNLKRRLEEQERQLTEQFLIEERVHREQVYHEQNLKRVEQEASSKAQQEIQAKQQIIERQLLEERLAHQKNLKDIQLASEIAEFEKSQASWNTIHERLRMEKIAQDKRLKELEVQAELSLMDAKQNEEQKQEERLLTERLLHEARLKELELEMQIQEHEKRYAATQQLDNYIRRDIELLILEKHRGDLIQEVKKAKSGETLSLNSPPAKDE